MTEDTPLTEVAKLLPREAAGMLMTCDSMVQEMTLRYVRQALVAWEVQGINLDPVQFEAVINTLVVQLGAQASVLIDLFARAPGRPR